MNSFFSSRTSDVSPATDFVPVSVITSQNPTRLTKAFALQDGEIEKLEGGMLISGQSQRRDLCGLEDFRQLLTSLSSNQALAYGLTEAPNVKLTTYALWRQEGCPEGEVPRTKEFFKWNSGLGIMMLDYDPEPETNPLDKDQLVALLREVFPYLIDASMIWFPSASSYIVNNQTQEQLSGLKGQRIYLLVKDARDIERAGKAMLDRLWAKGHGFVKISKSGAMLERTPFDGTVWQANRLDFAAGANCKPPLEQKRGVPLIVEGAFVCIDTKTAFPDLSKAELEKVEKAKSAAKSEKSVEAALVREQWLEERIEKLVDPDASDEEREKIRETLQLAANNTVLTGEFELYVDLDGEIRRTTVAEVLSDPTTYDGMQTLDPLEPEYKDGRLIGKLFLKSAKPVLHSFAHGPKTYQLIQQLTPIQTAVGQTTRVTDQTLEFLRKQSDIYDLGSALVLLDKGHAHALDEPGLAHYLGGAIQYGTLKKNKITPIDPPTKVVKQILSLGARRKLKPLDAIITAPTLRRDGSVLNLPGYDADMKLYLDIAGREPVQIDESPSKDTVSAALDRLMMPFSKFPFVEADDQGVFLATLLTAVVRGSLPRAPAFGFDAPVQGSGKSLLAECVSTLATGEAPTVMPHTHGYDDEEIRKRIFASLLQNSRVVVWDNVVGTFDSSALAALLTSDNYTDRKLGKSENISVPNRALFILTGNNLMLKGDMVRRVLVSRIDPRTDKPYAREFELNPLEHVMEHRQQMVADALTIIRGYLCTGEKAAPGKMASFEFWDELVRQPVAWVGQEILSGEYGDPMNAIDAAQADDPDLELLGEVLRCLHGIFGLESFTSADVINKMNYSVNINDADQGVKGRLEKAISEFSDKACKSSYSLGRILAYRVGRVVDKMRLVKSRDAHNKITQFRIEEVKREQCG